MSIIPCCFFPSKVIILDDNPNFLSQLSMALNASRNTFEYLDTPQKALEYINQTIYPSSFLTRLQQGDLNENIYDLYNEIYNPQRFNRISTIVVDYDMPGLNGLEVCKKITDPHIQKILLTGTADEIMAIEAFNAGYINHYVKKHGPETFSILNTYIASSSLRYFNLFSKSYLDAAAEDHHLALTDPLFQELFNKFLQEKNIVEYYLLDTTGSFLCLDTQGNPSIFFVLNGESLYHQDNLIADMVLEDPTKQFLTEELLQGFKERNYGFCFHYFEGSVFPKPHEWYKYIYPLQSLEGAETYYWVYIPHSTEINQNNILSFQQFKQKTVSEKVPK